ncbi:bifunctional 4-hydroxy-2-oxoglutarate aldolase/2-dehydro-3-deoxy-phosphogluconate aldolase [Leadbetterella byssophila]|uniref:bifunctional 4-hydroxy-2-oxoglutarate aldolase/2-dehydro-3-deoxy-phosphogluconate aldolase n=1 Tax=Leadbetterella byssophila TaxID=316068 RepID=UPI0039A27E5F
MISTLFERPLVPVYYHSDFDTAKAVVDACYRGGVRVFEFTNRGEQALEVFSELVAKNTYSDLLLGIGTIGDPQTAEKFIEAGARFVVQPFTTASVGKVCIEAGIPWIPGTLTPTEIHSALQMGASCVKIFPGNVVGPSYVKALRGPMPDVKIMVTGGVEPTAASLKEWFSAGVNAVGLGSQLFKNQPDQIASILEECFTHI